MSRAERSAKRSTKRPTKAGLSYSDHKNLALWRRHVEGVLSFLEQLDTLSVGKSTQWTAGMRKHYTSRLKHFLSRVPKGGETSAKLYRQRLNALAVK